MARIGWKTAEGIAGNSDGERAAGKDGEGLKKGLVNMQDGWQEGWLKRGFYR